MFWKRIAMVAAVLGCGACANSPVPAPEGSKSAWQMLDNFEKGLARWTHIDADNRTEPRIDDPQIAEIRRDAPTGDRYLLRKPAADGVVGNRKAIGFAPLPAAISVGETSTLYLRFSVESFPNNQSFGLANVPDREIPNRHYDAFEPMIRVTDKFESDGYRNDGALQVLGGQDRRYSNIVNPGAGVSARPLATDAWYEIWVVVNNAPVAQGGQRYDVYLRGGEFARQTLVYENAVFRMQREQPVRYFMTICNTGPKDQPYGNGGVRYDDIYIASGRELSSPVPFNQESE